MFKATLENVSLLRDSISSIAELIDEGIFKVTKEGIALIAADRAMVAVVDFMISASAFDSFELDKEQAIGLNIGNLLSVLKRAGADDKLTLNLQEAKLELTIKNSSRRRFVVPLLDLSQEEVPPIDQLQFTTKAVVRPDVLHSGIDDAEIIADSIVFDVSPTRFGMLAEGDVSKTELELEKGNEALMELKADGSVRSRYALDYLKKMIKAAKIADSVSLEYGQDYPMRLEFKSGDKVRLTMILAPRVTEE